MKAEIQVIDTPRLKNGFSTVSVAIPSIGAQEVLDLDFAPFYIAFGEPAPLTLDLLLIATISYLLDKCCPRSLADDYWTREFEIDFPVSEPGKWQSVRHELQECLQFLSGDEWTIGFQGRPDVMFSLPRVPRKIKIPTLIASENDDKPSFEAVSLFSGGLDSLSGVIDYLASAPGNLLLVGHHDATGPGGDQRRLLENSDLQRTYPSRLEPLRIRARPLPAAFAQPGQVVLSPLDREPTLRSRSMVFLALGLYAAHALGDSVPLQVPENGFIAINIPLTPSRIGTCSTRTTHPYFLDRVRAVVSKIGLGNNITNPYESKTKGEVLAGSADLETLKSLAPYSVSCAHATRRGKWVRRHARNCGYCVPCLVRRASLHHIGLDDGLEYGYDICAGELDLRVDVATDLRAVLDCLREVRSTEQVKERVFLTGPLPGDMFDMHVGVIERGLEELRSLMRDKATPEIRRLARIR
jgi:hypothetical protein